MAKSVRESCAIDQKPLFSKIGILVEISAVIMINSNGMEAILVSKPIKISVPQTISNDATNKRPEFRIIETDFFKPPGANQFGKKKLLILRKENQLTM
ncbi:MAG: hypothetical protein U5L45_11925 [Saprospiraceae bacterium]|nr:hypothetical protein [Saprospiraceae bacterium]